MKLLRRYTAGAICNFTNALSSKILWFICKASCITKNIKTVINWIDWLVICRVGEIIKRWLNIVAMFKCFLTNLDENEHLWFFSLIQVLKALKALKDVVAYLFSLPSWWKQKLKAFDYLRYRLKASLSSTNVSSLFMKLLISYPKLATSKQRRLMWETLPKINALKTSNSRRIKLSGTQQRHSATWKL